MEYEYSSLFYKPSVHKDLLIVPKGTVVNITPGHPPAMSSDWRIVTGDFVEESFELNEYFCSANKIQFGLCPASVVKFTINKPSLIDLVGKDIDVYIYFDYTDKNNDRVCSETLLKIGSYRVTKDEYSVNNNRRQLLAYDILYFIKNVNVTDWYNSLYTVDNESISISTLWNGLMAHLNSLEYDFEYDTIENTGIGAIGVKKTLTGTNITAETIISRIAEAMGWNVRINRYGRLVFVGLRDNDMSPQIYISRSMYEKPITYGKEYVGNFKKLTYFQNNEKIASVGSRVKAKRCYEIYDSFILADKVESNNPDLVTILNNILTNIKDRKYLPTQIKCPGNPSLEVGERYVVSETFEEKDAEASSYIFERRLTGIQHLKDVYISRGENDGYAYKGITDSAELYRSNDGNYNAGGADESVAYGSLHTDDFVETIRNIGYRLLNEPYDVEATFNSDNNSVSLKWKDPANIGTNEPVPATWSGTVVVRKEGSAPMHIWDGTIIKTSTTRNEHSTTPLVDRGLQSDKTYYYGIMPYDDDGNTKHYRWTKYVRVNTNVLLVEPVITSIDVNGTSVDINYIIPPGTYDYRKITYKEGEPPKDVDDGTSVNVGGEKTTITGLKPNTKYYFVLFIADGNGRKTQSNTYTEESGDEPSFVDVDLFSIDASKGFNDLVNNCAFTNQSLKIENGYFATTSTSNIGYGLWDITPLVNIAQRYPDCTMCIEVEGNSRGWLGTFNGSNISVLVNGQYPYFNVIFDNAKNASNQYGIAQSNLGQGYTDTRVARYDGMASFFNHHSGDCVGRFEFPLVNGTHNNTMQIYDGDELWFSGTGITNPAFVPFSNDTTYSKPNKIRLALAVNLKVKKLRIFARLKNYGGA